MFLRLWSDCIIQKTHHYNEHNAQKNMSVLNNQSVSIKNNIRQPFMWTAIGTDQNSNNTGIKV